MSTYCFYCQPCKLLIRLDIQTKDDLLVIIAVLLTNIYNCDADLTRCIVFAKLVQRRGVKVVLSKGDVMLQKFVRGLEKK